MKIQFKNTQEQVALIKAMASNDLTTAMKAREDFAAAMGPVIQQVVNFLSTAKLIYTDWQFAQDDDASFPLDMFYGTGVDQVQVWSQSIAGGTGTSVVTGLQELKVQTYQLETAIALLTRNVQRGRLPYVSMALNRAAQEVAIRQDRNAWLVVLKTLAEASTKGTAHVIDATTANVLQLDDFNRLLTLGKRLNTAFNSGTPANPFSNGYTDLFISYEMGEQLRSWAYQPMNTRAVPNTDESTAIPLPDNVRQQIYDSAGAMSIYKKNVVELAELGIGQAYNILYGAYQTSGFTTASDEIVLAVDSSRGALIRAVAQNTENGSELQLNVDDTFTKRSGKLGFYGGVEEGRICVDSRCVTGLEV